MRRRYLLVLALLTGSFVAEPAAGPGLPGRPAEAAPMQHVASGRVGALVPPSWEFRPIAASGSRLGLQAARTLADPSATAGGRRGEQNPVPRAERPGLEAWWVDATEVGLPSDYYYLAAEGPALRRLSPGRHCREKARRVVTSHRPLFDRPSASTGDYVATARGTCRAKNRVSRWGAFVAAPGFGPARRLGIPESGLYFAMVVVPDGPQANRRVDRLLSGVTFGETAVGDFLRSAGAGGPT